MAVDVNFICSFRVGSPHQRPISFLRHPRNETLPHRDTFSILMRGRRIHYRPTSFPLKNKTIANSIVRLLFAHCAIRNHKRPNQPNVIRFMYLLDGKYERDEHGHTGTQLDDGKCREGAHAGGEAVDDRRNGIRMSHGYKSWLN